MTDTIGRQCEGCGLKMQPGKPRTRRDDGALVCGNCLSGGDSTATATRVEAHGIDPADEIVIRHCPRCGSGQVIGYSDGTVVCDYCDLHFTVEVQPAFSAMPQTTDFLGDEPMADDPNEEAVDEVIEEEPIETEAPTEPVGGGRFAIEEIPEAGPAPSRLVVEEV